MVADFNAGKGQLILSDQSSNSGATDVKIDYSNLKEKPSFKMLALPFSFKLGWGSYSAYIAKTAFETIGVMICFVDLRSPYLFYDF